MKKYCFPLLFLITGCSHYIVNETGYVRPPKDYNFSYKKQAAKLTDNAIIDTNAIYYLHDSNYYRNSDAYKNTDAYMRFYADGHFKTQAAKESPKLEDINNVEKGIVGYYILKGNLVKMQTYGDINAGSDQLEFGIIDENGDLVILNENPRSDIGFDLGIGWTENGVKRKIEKSFFNPKKYKKMSIDGMTYEKPAW